MIALPPAPHLPGRNPRPDPVIFAACKDDPDLALRAGQVAFAARYYWEAHECWEGVWMAQPPASAARHLMRGLIQLANAGLKKRMGRDSAAARILALADAQLREVQGAPLGFTPSDVQRLRAQVMVETAI